MEESNLLGQIFSIPIKKGSYLIYSPLKHIAFIGNTAMVNAVYERCTSNTNNNQTLDFLDNYNFFEPSNIPIDTYKDSGVIYDSLVLFPTNRCNLRCKYCYASAGESPAADMDFGTAKAGIDFVMERVIHQTSATMHLGFHGGGEPTMNPDLIIKASEYALKLSRKNNVKIDLNITSNACWSDEMCRYICSNFSGASISFDGIPEVQNLQRPLSNGKGSSSLVEKNLRCLDNKGFPYGIRMTGTAESINKLSEGIDYICTNFKPRIIQVEPIFLHGRALQNYSGVNPVKDFISQFIKGCDIAEKHNIQLRYSGARPETITQRFCGAGCRALIITHEGDITLCIESYGREHPLGKKFIVGSFSEGKPVIDHERINSYIKYTTSQKKKCSGCFCKWHCAGDCTIKSLTDKNNSRCRLNQELTKLMLLNKIDKSGGILWSGEGVVK